MSDASTNKIQRPLSPHLQVYRLPMTALMSITHRITGVGLVVGTFLVAAFLLSAAHGEGSYNFVMGLATSILGQIILFLWSAALYYHMCSGIRHMIWDTGRFLSKKDSVRANYCVLAAAVTLTLVTWFMACVCYAK